MSQPHWAFPLHVSEGLGHAALTDIAGAISKEVDSHLVSILLSQHFLPLCSSESDHIQLSFFSSSFIEPARPVPCSGNPASVTIHIRVTAMARDAHLSVLNLERCAQADWDTLPNKGESSKLQEPLKLCHSVMLWKCSVIT